LLGGGEMVAGKIGGFISGLLVGGAVGGPIGAVVGAVVGLGAGVALDDSATPGSCSSSGGDGGRTVPMTRDSEGHISPAGGYTSEGHAVYGVRDSEGREQSVDYVNSEGYRTSSDSLYGDDD